MGKTNWKRVFPGGLLDGVVLMALGFAAYAIYMEKLYTPLKAHYYGESPRLGTVRRKAVGS